NGTFHYLEPLRVDVAASPQAEGEAPGAFALLQNHPNPFNPSTTIRFELAEAREVSLNVYNAMGQVVSVLASGPRAAGRYSVVWDASGIASGVYFYRLEAGNYVATKKLIVLR
ncbi:MAG TPA: T9SS type A sorting domain-containing protein, partial [Bacteroidota bacterium]|nr:T9SS type A sorting domain-containing protein [Bacteroidota bacterium]